MITAVDTSTFESVSATNAIDVEGLDVVVDVEARTAVGAGLAVTLEPATTSLFNLRIATCDASPWILDRCRLAVSVPAIDLHGLYLGGDPSFELGQLPTPSTRASVAANTGIPYVALVHRGGDGRFAMGLVGQLHDVELSGLVNEHSRSCDVAITVPDGAATLLEHDWTETVFITRSRDSWPETLRSYADVVAANMPGDPLPTPRHASEPVFCTWTAAHHRIHHEWVVENARLAADLGFSTWITDDGWHQAEGTFGLYEHAGRWRPDPFKFPDLRTHVDAVHDAGLRYLLWIAPLMIGAASASHAKFADLLIPGENAARFANLDPTDERTADHVATTMRRLIEDYGLDGFKIDFVDAVRPTDGRTLRSAPFGRSVWEVLTAAITSLREHHPELLIEVRNTYANLAGRHYGNLYQASDVPINFEFNRWQTAMLRLLAPDRAVVADPMLWHRSDTDENVAVHLINGIAAVPMLSVDLSDTPGSQLELIRHWIGFYREHIDTLAHGELRPTVRGYRIPVIDFVGIDETITMVFDDVDALHLEQADERRQVRERGDTTHLGPSMHVDDRAGRDCKRRVGTVRQRHHRRIPLDGSQRFRRRAAGRDGNHEIVGTTGPRLFRCGALGHGHHAACPQPAGHHSSDVRRRAHSQQDHGVRSGEVGPRRLGSNRYRQRSQHFRLTFHVLQQPARFPRHGYIAAKARSGT
ncbi:hypothetical protein BH24ACT5_BH24ACT5_16600 [soil metagenome]